MAVRKVNSSLRNHNKKHNNNNRRSGKSGNFKPASNSNRSSQSSVLPSPTVLQEYEYATEGAADRILEMAEVEQDRRHNWEDDYLLFYKKSLRIGQLCGFILLFSVIFSFVYLASNGKEMFAVYLAVIAFFSVALANFFASIGRRKNSKRPPRSRK